MATTQELRPAASERQSLYVACAGFEIHVSAWGPADAPGLMMWHGLARTGRDFDWIARALANHFKKTGDLDRHGKVDYTKSEIVKLRTQELVTQTTAISDIAQGAVAETDAAKRGITQARIATLSAAIAAYTKVMNAPRGQIVNRSALLKEVETDTAALVEFVNDMDDLVLQFDTTPTGHRFMEAWKRARIIVDVGGSNGGEEKPAPSPQPPQ